MNVEYFSDMVIPICPQIIFVVPKTIVSHM